MLNNWSDLSSVMTFMSQANNNLNVLTHPAYYTLRSKIKNKQKIDDNMSLLCASNMQCTESSSSSSSVDPKLVTSPIKVVASSPEQLTKGNIHLYDPNSFSSKRTYILDTDVPFSRDDFLTALRDITSNPIQYMNSSSTAISHSNNECDNEHTSNLSFLKLLDPTSLLYKCAQHGLIVRNSTN